MSTPLGLVTAPPGAPSSCSSPLWCSSSATGSPRRSSTRRSRSRRRKRRRQARPRRLAVKDFKSPCHHSILYSSLTAQPTEPSKTILPQSSQPRQRTEPPPSHLKYFHFNQMNHLICLQLSKSYVKPQSTATS